MRIAVLIDVENIGVGFAPAIMQRARQWGDVTIVRLFGDFTGNRHAEWCKLALAAGYETILQLSGGAGKNSTDIALTINSMDLLYSGAIDGFCLVSNDRDFVPLATRLRSAGKRVYAVCQKIDERVVGASTEAFALAPPLKPVLPVGPPPPPIVVAFRTVSGDRTEISLTEVGKLLRRHAPKLFEGTSKNGTVRQLLRQSGHFDELGEGSTLRVRLRS